MKKILAIMMAVAMLLGCISAFAEIDTTKLTFAYLTCDRTNEYWVTTGKGFEAACAEYGITGIVYDGEGDAVKQVSQAEDALAQGIDVMIMSPIDTAGDTIALMCKEKGVPVFIADGSSVSEDYVSLIISDNTAGAAMVADYAISLLGDKINAVVYDYGGSMEAMVSRQVGFRDAIVAAGYPCEMMLVKTREAATSATEDLLVSRPEVNCIFAGTDNTSMGAVAALEAAGKVGEVLVFGFDATNEGCDAISKGTLAGTVRQDPFNFTWQSVENAIKYLNGGQIEKIIHPQLTLVTKENVSDYYTP